MDRDALIDTVRTESRRLADVRPDELDTAVPTCPGWSVADLIVHLGRVHRWAAAALDTSPDGDPPRFGRRPEPGADLGDWLMDGADRLVARLDEIDLSHPCWTLTGPGVAGFWLRRQALETLVHRIDRDLASGRTEVAIDPELAAVGIEEWLELQAGRWYTPAPTIDGSLHLHATDGEGEWLVDVDAGGLRWTTGHAKGDVALRGDRASLFLVLWSRRPPAAVEVLGDEDLLLRVLAAASV